MIGAMAIRTGWAARRTWAAETSPESCLRTTRGWTFSPAHDVGKMDMSKAAVTAFPTIGKCRDRINSAASRTRRKAGQSGGVLEFCDTRQ